MFKRLLRGAVWSRQDRPAWIDIPELTSRLAAGDPILLIDVRQPDEYASSETTSSPGHLPGAINVPLGTIPERAGELARREQPIVLVCKTDRRSARAATELAARGLRNIAVLRGGTDAWHQQGLPLE